MRTTSTTVKARWRTAVNDRVGQKDFTCFEFETKDMAWEHEDHRSVCVPTVLQIQNCQKSPADSENVH